MTAEPPPFPNTGSITKGIGKLTPEVWDSLIWTAEWLHTNAASLDKLLQGVNHSQQAKRPWFLARLLKSKNVATNKYIYSWEKITLGTGNYSFTDDSDTLSSTGDSDEWDYAAMNVIEGYNTGDNTSTGTDEGAASFPATMILQSIGGGESQIGGAVTVLSVQTPVMMFTYRDSDNVARYVFSAANSYDGGCPE